MSSKQYLPKYVHEVQAKGKRYYYVRFKGQRIGSLPAPNHPDFLKSYLELLKKATSSPSPGPQHGSIAWLIGQYLASQAYLRLTPTTQKAYKRNLNRLELIESFPCIDIKRRHIKELQEDLNDRPRAAQLFGQVTAKLFSFGIMEYDLEMNNPALGLGRSEESESYLAWTEEQMAHFEASKPPRYLMSAYMIARYTGPRRADIASLLRSDYDGAGLKIANSKTRKKKRTIQNLYIPAPSNLQAYLNDLPPTMTIVAYDDGSPVPPGQLSKALRKHLNALAKKVGDPTMCELVLHGLRHTAGKALAEAGCTPHEIQAVLGHTTLQMVEHYTKAAAQKELAKNAITKLSSHERED